MSVVNHEMESGVLYERLACYHGVPAGGDRDVFVHPDLVELHDGGKGVNHDVP